jgi:hypothetical protein
MCWILWKMMTIVCNFLIACVSYLEEAPAVCDFVVLGCDMRRLLCLCVAISCPIYMRQLIIFLY